MPFWWLGRSVLGVELGCFGGCEVRVFRRAGHSECICCWVSGDPHVQKLSFQALGCARDLRFKRVYTP